MHTHPNFESTPISGFLGPHLKAKNANTPATTDNAPAAPSTSSDSRSDTDSESNRRLKDLNESLIRELRDLRASMSAACIARIAAENRASDAESRMRDAEARARDAEQASSTLRAHLLERERQNNTVNAIYGQYAAHNTAWQNEQVKADASKIADLTTKMGEMQRAIDTAEARATAAEGRVEAAETKYNALASTVTAQRQAESVPRTTYDSRYGQNKFGRSRHAPLQLLTAPREEAWWSQGESRALAAEKRAADAEARVVVAERLAATAEKHKTTAENGLKVARDIIAHVEARLERTRARAGFGTSSN